MYQQDIIRLMRCNIANTCCFNMRLCLHTESIYVKL
jgi:hypothetical protein